MLEIPDADMPCLEFSTKAYLYNLEKDGKNTEKGNFWKQLYGGGDNNDYLTGELSQVASRARTREGGTIQLCRNIQHQMEQELIRCIRGRLNLVDYLLQAFQDR